MELAYQYRLKPNRTQERHLTTLLAVACRLYNDALAERRNAWEHEGRTVTYLEQARKLKALREIDKEVALLNFSAAQHVLRRLDKAFQRFFSAVKAGQKVGYPRFKKLHRFRTLEFTYGDGTKIKPDERGRLQLYIQNVGMVKVVWHRPLPEQSVIKQVWVTRKADGWFVTFALEVPDETLRQPLPPTGRAVGIDVGVENLLALSDGRLVDNPKWLKKVETKIAEKQRIVSRKVKGSKRWKRMCRQVAKLHLKIARQRRDFYFKVATELVREYDLICVEDLNIKGLTQGNLSKSVLDASWSVFLNRILPYKAWRAGREVIYVPANGTSQTCAHCGTPVPKDLSVRWHDCPHCGFSVHRDINSALLILQLGLERARRGADYPSASCLHEAVGFSRR